MFRSDERGRATPIPFQIDEINQFGDYVLDQGGTVTKNDGNGVFDLQDELSFMGDDVGPAVAPKVWPAGNKPYAVFEILQVYRGVRTKGPQSGAVYLAVYLNTPPRYRRATTWCLIQRKVELRPRAIYTISTNKITS